MLAYAVHVSASSPHGPHGLTFVHSIMHMLVSVQYVASCVRTSNSLVNSLVNYSHEARVLFLLVQGWMCACGSL
jgi:hypothetical protein